MIIGDDGRYSAGCEHRLVEDGLENDGKRSARDEKSTRK
jgi:hypothetical protein